ncbi:MAG: PQQ-like beta-propeller repeat protein [Phycisphaerales bacterium]|nr:MAG: PQQ-like beta-propeller repeat protein [Phycisphaerales bacterium]
MKRAIPVILTALLVCPAFVKPSGGAWSDSGPYDYQAASDSLSINAGDAIYPPLGINAPDGDLTFMGDGLSLDANDVVPTITVEKPAAGYVWAAGSKRQIVWSSIGYEGNVSILLTAGASWQVIQSSILNTGSYFCQLPQQLNSSECQIAVVPSPADFTVFCEQSGPFTIHPDSQGPEVASAWPSLGGDFDRTGLSAQSGPQFGCIKWKFEPAGAVPTSVTIGAEGRTHIACEDGRLYTLGAAGILFWIFNANSPLTSSPTVGPDGSLYVGAENGRLYVIDPNGAIRWTHTTNAPIYSSPAVSADGSVFVGSQEGRLYALAPDGGEKWSIATKGPGLVPEGAILASPAIGADGTVYIGGLYDPNLYALDPNDGTLNWKCSFTPAAGESEEAGWPFASPVVAPDGTIYQTLLYDSNLYAIDPNDGDILWSTDLADPGSDWLDPNYSEDYPNPGGWSEPALGPDGTVYVSFDDPYLRAVEPNGAIKWMARLGAVGGFTLTVGNDGLIYAASDDGYLYVVDAAGWQVSRFATGQWLNHPVIADEHLIIVSDGQDYSPLITTEKNAVWAISRSASTGQHCDLCLIEDLNTDGNINFLDFALLLDDWLECTAPGHPCHYEAEPAYLTGDIDMDGYVFLSDLISLADRWLNSERPARPPRLPGPPGPPPGWPTPPDEPPPKPRACFPADTPVWIEGSLTNISNVTAGQKVGKSNCLAASGSLKAIERFEEHEGSFDCRDLLLETGERISVVDSHCFMLESGRWAPVQDLKAGSKLKSMNGSVAVKSIARRQTAFVGRVYNLKIKGSDRYFVGKLCLIVRDY